MARFTLNVMMCNIFLMLNENKTIEQKKITKKHKQKENIEGPHDRKGNWFWDLMRPTHANKSTLDYGAMRNDDRIQGSLL